MATLKPVEAMEDQTFTFSWEVKNFKLFFSRRGNFLESHRFVAGILNDTEWIGSFLQGISYAPYFISFFLKRCADNGPNSIELHATLTLFRADGTPEKDIDITENLCQTAYFSFLLISPRSEVERFYLNNDNLKIRCVLRKTQKELTSKRLFARTAGDIRKICKEWVLPNFSQTRQGIVLEDSVRLTEGGYLLFDVCLSIEERQSGGVMKIVLTRRCDRPGEPMMLNTLITVLDAQGIESEIWKQDKHVFHMRTREEVWQFPTFITKAPLVREKNKYLAKDVLKLKCEITISLGTMTSQIDLQKTSLSVEKSDTRFVDTFTKDMEDLFNNKRFADVKLRVLGEIVLAHRIVLQSRSKKFAEMLVGMEGTDNVVLDVPDVAMITLKRMLKYMYTDEIDDLEYDDAVEAYIAAHKYRIESLMCKYSFVLQSELKVNNVCSIFKLADEFCDQNLKKYALDLMELC